MTTIFSSFLSKDAAEKLLIKEDDIITVKASLVKKYDSEDGSEKELSDDPDLNPSKAVFFTEPEEEITRF